MDVSVDISLYPLKEDFKRPIKDFINKLDNQKEFRVKRNNMSTSVFGEYKAIMQWLNENIEESLLNDQNAVFVIKIVGGDYYRD